MAGVLYVVATPIGNLNDLSHRAEDVLKSVAIVAAEDTRRTSVLLQHIDHRAPELVSLHEHNEEAVSDKLIARLADGDAVAIVSDAGTPLVNDPGHLLVKAAWQAGVQVVPVPGPSAVTAALSVCPLPCQDWRYVGFLPAKSGMRSAALQAWLRQESAILFLEAPHRILASLGDIAAQTERRVMLGRELTKKFETIYVGSAAEVMQELGDDPKGEFVGIIESRAVATTYDAEEIMDVLLTELAPAKAAKLAAKITGAERSVLYESALARTGKAGTDRKS